MLPRPNRRPRKILGGLRAALFLYWETIMSNLFHLAQDAAKALTAYERGPRQEEGWPYWTTIASAVIEYGKALREGRKVHASHKVFSKWIEENDLDQTKPFDQPQGRKCGNADCRNCYQRNFFRLIEFLSALIHGRAIHAMKWIRLQSWFEAKPRAPRNNKPPKRAKVGRPRKDEPTPVPRGSVAPARGYA